MSNAVFPFLAGALVVPALAQEPTASSTPSSTPTSYPIECDPSDCDEPVECDEPTSLECDPDESAGSVELVLSATIEPRVADLEVVSMPSSSEAPNTSSDAPAGAPEVEPAPEYGLTGAWGGLRASLADRGIEFGASLILDTHQIASGGIDRDTITHSLFDFTASFDLAKLAGLKDAVLVADAYVINGRNPTDSVGDFQSFSSISAGHVAQLGQLYYEQYFLEQKLRVKLGKADTNSDFAAPDSSGDFVHSASAFSPTLVGMATYPNPATCALAFWQPNEAFYVGARVYDGATNAGIATGGHGPSTFFGSPSDLFLICESGYRWTCCADDLAGRFTLGAWRHTGDFDRFAGGTEDGTEGWYASVDQELARLGGDGGGALAAFLQWGNADQDVADVDSHFGAGLACTGCCGRADDSLGFYVSSVGFSEGAGTSADS